MGHDDRTARQGANLARHLNQTYPDTVLFLARHAACRPVATAAELESVDADGLQLTVLTHGTVETLHVPLPAGDGPDTDIRARVRELLRLTRLHAPGEALTSLEERTGGTGAGPHRHG